VLQEKGEKPKKKNNLQFPQARRKAPARQRRNNSKEVVCLPEKRKVAPTGEEEGGCKKFFKGK